MERNIVQMKQKFLKKRLKWMTVAFFRWKKRVYSEWKRVPKITYSIKESIHKSDTVHYNHGSVTASFSPQFTLVLEILWPRKYPCVLFKIQHFPFTLTASDPKWLVCLTHLHKFCHGRSRELQGRRLLFLHQDSSTLSKWWSFGRQHWHRNHFCARSNRIRKVPRIYVHIQIQWRGHDSRTCCHCL